MDVKTEQQKKPIDSDFYQQRYAAITPLLTPPCVIILFLSIGILMLAVGVGVLYSGMQIVTYTSDPYEVADSVLNAQPLDAMNNTLPLVHNLTLKVDADMKAPIYFYYELDNFFQNHRRVVTSRSNQQLEGRSNPDLSGCDPLINYGASQPLYPCGLLANSFFNDSFKLLVQGVELVVQRTGIAWKSDIQTKFKSTGQAPSMGPQGQLPAVDDEDFIVWMRAAALPRFRKLKYILNADIPKGTNVVVQIEDSFRVTGFGGSKRVVLTNLTSLGGSHTFLGIVALILGVLGVLMALAFSCKHHYGARPLGQLQHFNWPTASKQFMSHVPKL